MKQMERKVVFAGSFDPFTRGHEALVSEALNLFDRVVIAIGDNIAKRGLLDVEARRELIADLYAGQERVEVALYRGLTGDFATRIGAVALLRGVRNTVDFEYEKTMAAANRRLYPHLVTLLLYTPSEVADISSSTVRELLAFGRDVGEFLPRGVELERYLKQAPSDSMAKKA